MVRELRAGTAYATYLTGVSGPMYKLQNGNGTIRWYIYDGLGSVLGEVDPSGNVTTSARYDVYGGVRSRTGTATSAHGFVGNLGHTSDAETGLIYMRARCMDPVTGRFVSEDPAWHGKNWFVYCSGAPTCRHDRTGRDDTIESVEGAEEISNGLDEEGANADEEAERSSLSRVANFAKAKKYSDDKLLDEFSERLGVSRDEASDILHAFKKENGLKAGDHLSLDRWGGVYAPNGVFLGFIEEI